MNRHFATAALLTAACYAGSANAVNVLFVDNETPDGSWENLIESVGHTYTLFDTGTYNLSLNNQSSIDYVESFDVIVMSGSNPAFNAVRAHGATWNTLSTPMINMGNFLISGNFSAGSWQWTTPTTGGAPNASGVSDVLDPLDPIWTAVPLTPGTPPTIDLYSGTAGHLDLGTDSFLPGITTVAAQSSNNDRVSIAHADPGEVRTGSQEQYFIAGMTGGNGNPVPFTIEGEQVFLNAIAGLGGFLIPEPSSLSLLAIGGLLVARRRRAA